jgi:hypothetical protein
MTRHKLCHCNFALNKNTYDANYAQILHDRTIRLHKRIVWNSVNGNFRECYRKNQQFHSRFFLAELFFYTFLYIIMNDSYSIVILGIPFQSDL